MSVLKEFAQKWCHPDDLPQPVEPSTIADAERALGVVFPEDYKSAVIEDGLPHPTAALLDNLEQAGSEIHDLSDLLKPAEIAATTKDWRAAGLPSNLVIFGNDCMGNCFCFDENDLRAGPVPSSPIYFWDHDFDETKRIAPSFRDWIGSYLGSWSTGISYKDF
ncbi:MAG: SMI1/KNR4 family protein [Hyphomicrobiaceae bacterium]